MRATRTRVLRPLSAAWSRAPRAPRPNPSDTVPRVVHGADCPTRPTRRRAVVLRDVRGDAGLRAHADRRGRGARVARTRYGAADGFVKPGTKGSTRRTRCRKSVGKRALRTGRHTPAVCTIVKPIGTHPKITDLEQAPTLPFFVVFLSRRTMTAARRVVQRG